jgi:hypothetical protein
VLGLRALSLSRCGNNNPTPVVTAPSPTPTRAPTPLPSPATLADLSASVASPQADALINCADDVVARVSLTNHAPASVSVTGIRKSTRIPRGQCGASEDFTYRPSASFAAGGQTTVILNQPLYSGGSGCCSGCNGQTCKIEQTLTVIAAPGEIPAGTFSYFVNFIGCQACSSSRSTAFGDRCSPDVLSR